MLRLTRGEEIAQCINIFSKPQRQFAARSTNFRNDAIFWFGHVEISSSGVSTSGGS